MNNHGGKRNGAGRKQIGNKKSNVLRVDDDLLLLIRDYRKGNLNALHNQNTTELDALKVDLDGYKARGAELILLRDKMKLELGDTYSQIRHFKGTIERLKDKVAYLEHKNTGCMAIKANGSRCTRLGNITEHRHGIEMSFCKQHSK